MWCSRQCQAWRKKNVHEYRAPHPAHLSSTRSLGEARPDWQIYSGIAEKLGFDWGYDSPEEIMKEAASLTPLIAGVSYDKLDGFNSLQWPVQEDGTDTRCCIRMNSILMTEKQGSSRFNMNTIIRRKKGSITM